MSRPAAARLELTPAWLAEQYVVQRQTVQQIADASGYSSQYVRDRLPEFRIGGAPDGRARRPRDIDRGSARPLAEQWRVGGDHRRPDRLLHHRDTQLSASEAVTSCELVPGVRWVRGGRFQLCGLKGTRRCRQWDVIRGYFVAQDQCGHEVRAARCLVLPT